MDNQNEQISIDEILKISLQLLTEKAAEDKGNLLANGACIITTSAGSVYCAEISQNDCTLLKGNFIPGGKCPK
jgi:hypothetical protein